MLDYNPYQNEEHYDVRSIYYCLGYNDGLYGNANWPPHSGELREIYMLGWEDGYGDKVDISRI